MSRQITCRTCGRHGHNKRTCPVVQEGHDKVEKLIKKYGQVSLRELLGATSYARNSYGDEDYIDWRERDAYMYIRVQREKNNTRKSRGRKCSFCRVPGHNRKTCSVKVGVNAKQEKTQSYIHRFAASVLRATKCIPGALLSKEVARYDKDYKVLPYQIIYGIVIGIAWDSIGTFDADIDEMPADNVLLNLTTCPVLDVKWTVPKSEHTSAHVYSYDPEPRSYISIAANAITGASDNSNNHPRVGGYKFVSGPSNSEEWKVTDKNYKGADNDGCPADWSIKLRGIDQGSLDIEDKKSFVRRAGIICGPSDGWAPEVISFDERER